MKKSLLLVSVFHALGILSCLLPSASAQVVTELSTESLVGVRVSSFATSNSDELAAATRQAQLRNLAARFSGAGSGVSTVSFPSLTDGDVRVRWAATAAADFAFPSVAGTYGDAGSETQSLVWSLRGVGRGTLVVDVDATRRETTPNPFPTATLDLDVGGDGSTELRFQNAGRPTLAVQRRYQLVLEPGQELRVGVRASNRAAEQSMFRTASSTMNLRMRWEPDPVRPAQIQSYGTGCGAAFGVRDAIQPGGIHRLSFTAQSTLGGESVAFVFGSEQLSLPIGISGCTLYVEPVGAVLATADGAGTASLVLDLPGPLRAVAYAQAFPLIVNDDWFASQGVRIEFDD